MYRVNQRAAEYIMARPMQMLALVQGVGGICLGAFTWATVGDSAGQLTLPRLWALMLVAGGAASLALVARRSEMSWALTGATLSTAMLGRGLDIWFNVDEFVGRPGLAVAVWLCMGSTTLAAWAAVGAMAGWESDG